MSRIEERQENEELRRRQIGEVLCAKGGQLAVIRECSGSKSYQTGDVVLIDSTPRTTNVSIRHLGAKSSVMIDARGLLLLSPETASNVQRIPVTSHGDGPKFLFPEEPKTSIDELEFSPDLRAIFDDLAYAFQHEAELGPLSESYGLKINSGRVIILSGVSGTGKTSFAHALAAANQARVLKVGTVANGSEYVSVSQRANVDALRVADVVGPKGIVALIDDGDDMISARYQGSDKHRESLVTNLLKAIDASPRALIIITTNAKPDDIESALRTRARLIELGEATQEARAALCQRLIRPDLLAPGVSLAPIYQAPFSMRELRRACERLIMKLARRHLVEGALQQILAEDVSHIIEDFGQSRSERAPIGFVSVI